MRNAKIVMIGAGSAEFGPGCLRDAVNCTGLAGSTMALVDIDRDALEVMAGFARKLNEVSGANLKIEHTTDRREALPDADFVITSFAMERNELWKLDWKIPLKHGIKQVLGENGGPGGLSHSLRNIHVLLAMCRDMEELCPNAWLLNFSNPESRLCLAVSNYSSIKAVGLCHGIAMGIDSVSHLLGLDPAQVDVKAAGLNHFTWMLSVHHKETGEDLYPALREKSRKADPSFLPLTRQLFEDFGLFPSPSDDHIGEYIGWAWDKCIHHGYDFDAADERRATQWDMIVRMANGEEPMEEYSKQKSGELEFNVIRGILADTNELLGAVNMVNNGCVTNLPDDAVVEVPAIVSGNGIDGLRVGELPTGIAAMCNTQIGVQKLTVEAAATGSRDLALQAMLADPVVQDYDAAEKCLNELLSVHKAYLPQFE
ncbi:MAG: alpha-glucosidase/alpha-galactosidase [Armatimonadota bacterium]|nr:alpha-glucosidase/alpha-galactosidase [Armatimonadota bacterium]